MPRGVWPAPGLNVPLVSADDGAVVGVLLAVDGALPALHIEDGGELLVVSIIAAYVAGLTRRGPERDPRFDPGIAGQHPFVGTTASGTTG